MSTRSKETDIKDDLAGDEQGSRFGKGTVLLMGLLVGAILALICALGYRYYLYNPHAPQIVLGFFLGKKPYFSQDAELGWAPTPNLDQDGSDPDRAGKHQFRSDEHGFRSAPIPPGFSGRKVVLLGDSMIWGLGVDQQRVAGTLLQKKLGARTHVIVAASPGWSTDQEYLFFNNKVLPLKPDVVLWFITASNDVIHNMTHQPTSGVLYKKPRFELDPAGKLRLVPVDPDAERKRMGESVRDVTSELNLFYKRSDRRFSTGLALTAAILAQGKRRWTKAGVEVHLVQFKPAIMTPKSRTYLEFAQEVKDNPGDFSYEAALANLALMSRLTAAPMYLFENPAGTTFLTDDHLNEKGHAQLATFIAGILDGTAQPRWGGRKQGTK